MGAASAATDDITAAPVAAAAVKDSSTTFTDPAFVSLLLGGADESDPLIQAALAQLQEQQQTGNHAKDTDTDNSKKRKGEDGSA